MNGADGPPCQHRVRCTNSDGLTWHACLHTAACPLSTAMISRRSARIRALAPAEMRAALTFLSGWTPTGLDFALDDADTVRELVPGDMPEGAL